MLRQLRSYISLVSRIWRAPGNRGRRPARLLRSMAWLINKKTLRRPWTLPVYTEPDLKLDLRLRCHPGSIIALHVIQRSEWHDWDTAKFITRFLRPGDTFVDVGANIGLYTLPAARIVGMAGTVLAVEPSPVNRTRLQENLALNHLSTVRLEPCAVGEQPGELAFQDDDALAHIVQPQAETTRTDTSSSATSAARLRVPVKTLDSILPTGAGEIALMKVDVEGFELSVFRGALHAMQSGRLPVILFEMNHSYLRYGLADADVLAFLRQHGYTVARYEHDSRRLVHEGLEGDLIACTPRGWELIQQRLAVR